MKPAKPTKPAAPPASLFGHIAVIAIPVRDLETAKAFYRDVLGFALMAEAPEGGARTWAQMGLAGAQTSVTLVIGFTAMPAGSLHGVVISVKDPTAARANLVDKGVDSSEVQSADWGKFFTFADPDGNSWVAMQR